MPKKFLSIYFILSIHWVVCYGQEASLSQKATEAFALAFQNSDSAILIAIDVLRLAETERDHTAIAAANNSIGWALMHQGYLDSAILHLNESLKIYRELESEFDIVRLSINLGEVYTKKSLYEPALYHLREGDSLSNLIQDVPLQTDVKRQLAIVYRESGDTQQASSYFQQALDGFLQQKDHFRYVNTAASLSILYRKMGLTDSSLSVLQRSLQLAINNNGTDYQVAMLHENIGETYFSKGLFNEALFYFQKAYKTFLLLNNRADLAYEALSIGKTLSALHRYSEAENYLIRSYKWSDTLKATNYQIDASFELTTLYERTGNWRDAHFYLKKANALKDSLDLSTQLSKIAEMKEQYESENKEREIELLKTQQQLTQSQAKRASLLQYIFILLFVAAVALVWLLAYKIRVKKKLDILKEQERMAQELEDEKILNQFAVSLYGKNTTDDILWDIAHNCIELLHFEDCVIYRADYDREMLIQTAAAGPKKIANVRVVHNPIEIPFGKGIVGAVVISGKPELIKDVRLDNRYIIDDATRISEITVPIIVDGKIFGIIDSEGFREDFYTNRHLTLLQNIAAVCASRLLKLLAEEQLRNVIARDLHDEMGSTLTSIHILSKLAINQSPDKDGYLSKIKAYTGKMMESMSDIIWAINPRHDTAERLLLRMKEFSVELLEPAGINCQFTPLGDDAPVLTAEERKFVYLIFKEAINNIVKYSKATNVSITFERNEKELSLSIIDDGIGFDKALAGSGHGLDNMKTRAHAIGARLKITSEMGKGTSVILEKSIT